MQEVNDKANKFSRAETRLETPLALERAVWKARQGLLAAQVAQQRPLRQLLRTSVLISAPA